MILTRDKEKFEQLISNYKGWEDLRAKRQQSLYEDMTKIATRQEIAAALKLNRKTLYNRHEWKKTKTNRREMHLEK